MPLARLAGLTAGALTLALTGVGATATAFAEPLPADYSGSTHGDMVDLSVVLSEGLSITALDGATIGHSATSTDSTATPATTAESANLEAALAGQGIAVDSGSAQAPPSSTYSDELGEVDVPGLLDTGLINGFGEANFVSTTECVPDGTVLTESTTQLATLDLGITEGLPVLPSDITDALTSIASLGDAETDAVETTGTTYLDGTSVVSEQQVTLSDLTLLGGLAVVRVDGPVTLTATSTGSGEGTIDYSNPTATVDLGGGNVVDVEANGDPTPVPPITIDGGLLGTLEVTLALTLAPTPEDGTTGPGVSADLPNLLSIDLGIAATGALATLLGDDVADVSLDLSRMQVSATAPAGGVECDVADPDEPTDPGTDPAGPPNDGRTSDVTDPPEASDDAVVPVADSESVGTVPEIVPEDVEQAAEPDDPKDGTDRTPEVLPATGGPAGALGLLLVAVLALGSGAWLLRCRVAVRS